MPEFKPVMKRNRILHSEMDFTRFTKKNGPYSATADVTSTLRVSKDKTRILCDVSFALGGEEEPLFIRMTTRSRFQIADMAEAGFSDPEAMREECRKQAVDYLYKRVKKLYRLHTGADLPLPDGDADEDDDA